MGRAASATRAWCGAHPLVVVAAATGLLALVHAVWIWTHRAPGAIDPDESGYLASALRIERGVRWTFIPGLVEVAKTGTGPFVPSLSVPLLLVGPHDPRTAMLVQPLLLVGTAVAVAAVTRRLAGSSPAIAAGLVVAVVPTMTLASLSYWLGLGAAFGLVVALWALLASERLTNRWTYVYGAGVAVMLLSRTMTLGYLPAVAAAGLVMAGRRRESLVGLARAAACTIVLAGPWYVVGRHSIFGYLFSYGYGGRSELFGERRLDDRLVARLDRFHTDLGTAVVIAGFVVVACAAFAAATGRWRPGRPRETAAMAAVVVVGFGALMSTANAGVWFELPIVGVLVAVVASLLPAVPRPARLGLGGLVAVAATMQLLCAWWVIDPGPEDIPLVGRDMRSTHFEPAYEQYDPRFTATRRDEQRDAATEWWEVSTETADEIRRTGGEDAEVTFSGSFLPVNSNTVQLAAQLEGWTVRLYVPDTVARPAERAEALTPEATESDGSPVIRDGRLMPRILVVADHEHHLFPADADTPGFLAQARDVGWEEVAGIAMPDGGRVLVMLHPDRPRG